MTLAFVVLAAFLLLLVFGMPIAFALGVSALAGFLWSGGPYALVQFPIVAYQMLDSSTFLAVPLFILMGTILFHGKVGADFFNLAASFFGHYRAGAAIATICACAIFSAVSASSLATAATIGALSVPAMLKQGYPKRLVYGPIAAGGTLGILIPPSGVMILYGAMTDESIGDLFTAGFIPGLMLTAMLCTVAVIMTSGSDVKALPRASWAQRWASFKQSFWGILLPVIVLGGLYAGWFTASEAGAIAVVLSLIVTMLLKRTLTLQQLPRVLIEGTKTSGFLFAVIVASGLFNHLMTEMGVVQTLTSFVVNSGTNQTVILILISLLLFVLGMFFEVAALVLVMVPILFPVIKALGIDPIWFGIFFVVNIEFAYLTPPVGMNLFIIQEIGRRYTPTGFNDVVKSTMPYILCHILMLALLLAFPKIALVLVR
jgi:C4-dicarboxylate transporter DctM subunit